MDTAQWPQGIWLVKPREEQAPSSNNTTTSTTCSTARPQLVERKPRPQREKALNCPRCNSTNTKFCYYNNYSLTQPRYFCKSCRRYWTEGGSLRNVPVGGGSRKNKRSYTSSSITTRTNTAPASSVSTISTKMPSDLIPPPLISLHNPEERHLNLSFSSHSMPHLGDFPNMGSSNGGGNISKPSNAISALSAMGLIRTKISGVGLGPFMTIPMPIPEPSAVCTSGFGLQDLKPSPSSLNLDGISGDGEGAGRGFGTMQAVQDGGRLLFPFGDLRQVSSGEFEQNRGQGGDPPGFWNGIMGAGGGSW